MELIASTKAIIVRLLFAIHGSIGVVALVEITNVDWYLLAECLIFISVLETFVTLKITNRGEWKWFLPSVFIYLLWVVPVVLTLESHALDFRRAYQSEMRLQACPLSFEPCQDLFTNNTVDEDQQEEKVPVQFEKLHYIVLDSTTYNQARTMSLIMMQTMMMVLIAGRWLGPKGTLTRDQLSQLLLAYMGMAADMLEFATETLKMPETSCVSVLVYVVLGAWSWSLLQFTLGLTATKQRKPRVVATGPALHAKEDVDRSGPCPAIAYCCETEIWALLVSVMMQDGPYLIIRLFIMIKYQSVGQSTIFFTCKNGILFMLQMYRMYVVIIHRNDNKKDEEKGDGLTPLVVKGKTSPIIRKGNGRKSPNPGKRSPHVTSSPLIKKPPKTKKSPQTKIKKSPKPKKSQQIQNADDSSMGDSFL